MTPYEVDQVTEILRLLFLMFVAGVGTYLCFKYREESNNSKLLTILGLACILGVVVNGVAAVLVFAGLL